MLGNKHSTYAGDLSAVKDNKLGAANTSTLVYSKTYNIPQAHPSIKAVFGNNLFKRCVQSHNAIATIQGNYPFPPKQNYKKTEKVLQGVSRLTLI